MAAQFSKIFGADGENQSDSAAERDASAAPAGWHEQSEASGEASDPSQFDTFLGAGSSVEGRLVCKGATRLSGAVKGEITGDGLVTIDDGAVVTADVNVREASISGRVIGNVSAAARVTLGATALIDGDIKTPSLSIAEGAQIMGRIEVKPGAGENNRLKPTSPVAQSPDQSPGQKPVAEAVGEGQG